MSASSSPPSSSSNEKAFITGSVLIFLSNLLVAGLSFLLMFLLARFYHDELWGVVSSVKLVVHTTTVIVLNGSWLGVVHFTSRAKTPKERTIQLAAAIRVSFVGGLFIDFLAVLFYYSFHERLFATFTTIHATSYDILVFQLSMLFLFPLHFTSLSSINYLIGLQDFKSNALVLTLSSIVTTGVSFLFTLLVPLSALPLGMVCGALVGIIGTALIIRGKVSYVSAAKLAFNLKVWPSSIIQVLTYSIPLTLATTFTQINEILKLKLAYFYYVQGAAEVQLALLNFALLLTNAARLPQQAMAKVILPQISSETKLSEIRIQVDRAIRLTLVIVGSIIFLLGMYSKLIVPLIIALFRIDELSAISKETLISTLLSFFSVSSLFLAVYLVLASISAGIDRADLNMRAELIGMLSFILGITYWQDYGALKAIGRASILSTALMLTYMTGKLVYQRVIAKDTLIDMAAVIALISPIVLLKDIALFSKFYTYSTEVEKFGLVILVIPLIIWTGGESIRHLLTLAKGTMLRTPEIEDDVIFTAQTPSIEVDLNQSL